MELNEKRLNDLIQAEIGEDRRHILIVCKPKENGSYEMAETLFTHSFEDGEFATIIAITCGTSTDEIRKKIDESKKKEPLSAQNITQEELNKIVSINDFLKQAYLIERGCNRIFIDEIEELKSQMQSLKKIENEEDESEVQYG